MLAHLLAGMVSNDTLFSVQAQSQALQMTLGCGQRALLWDLPPGQIAAVSGPGTAAPPPVSSQITVTLREGARADLLLQGDGRWSVRFDPDASNACGAAGADAVTVTINGAPLPASAGSYLFVSQASAAFASAWPLRGRVLIGDEVREGSGSSAASKLNGLLLSGQVEARTLDALTGQRRTLHEERLDRGSMLDTHACLDQREPDVKACVQRSRSTTEGFFQLRDEGDRAQRFEVQLTVTGREIGLRSHGAAQRSVGVSWWFRTVTTPWVQIVAAAVALLSSLITVLTGWKVARA